MSTTRGPSDADLDRILAAHFHPAPMPGRLARRIVNECPWRERTMQSLARNLSIEVTERGVSFVAPGRVPAALRARGGPGPAARRLAEKARRELAEYLSGDRSFFSVPVDLSGLPEFQRRVLQAAARIPAGETRSYSWIARRIGRPRAARAVGTALGRNPVPFIVPCHRVLRGDGSLGGYAFGLGLKRRLLDLERSTPALEGCSSTRIVCRVGCDRGRRMRPDHRVIFASLPDARAAGYRPCLVCRPVAA
jgi:O-6-methylguanine DNA methyltransferase